MSTALKGILRLSEPRQLINSASMVVEATAIANQNVFKSNTPR